jgi:hypothetical protein
MATSAPAASATATMVVTHLQSLLNVAGKILDPVIGSSTTPFGARQPGFFRLPTLPLHLRHTPR